MNRFSHLKTRESIDNLYEQERLRYNRDYATASFGDPILAYGLDYCLNELNDEYADALERVCDE